MLQGKHALVTGSTEGLGRAIARALARQGASVTLNGLCPAADGERAAATLAAETGASVGFDGADLADVEAIARMISRAGAPEGIDILVNNAVVRHLQPIEAFTVAEWDAGLAVNLSAAFHAVRLALPGMKAKGWGRIINIASIYATRGDQNRVGYVTAKAGLLGLTRAIALETATSGVTCNAVCPGSVPSAAILDKIAAAADVTGVDRDSATRAYVSARHPTERFVDADNVAALVAFLCGPAGADITGSTFPIDGGWSAR